MTEQRASDGVLGGVGETSRPFDALVIGKGPAGISAAIYLARAGYSVLAIGKDCGALERAETVENYYGFPEPVGGAELVARGVAQARRFGVTVLDREVVSLSYEGDFAARVSGAEADIRARTVLLATGKQRSRLHAPGFEELRGRGISFCATCDGFFYRGKRVAVVGSGDYAASELSELLAFTKDVTVFTNGERISSARFPDGVTVVEGRIESFVGGDRLSGIAVSADPQSGPASGETREYPVDGAFIAIGTAGAADFAAKLGVELRSSDIVVDGSFMTNLPGVFAAGDCVGGFLQVAKAVSDGALAAKSMISFLKKA